MGLSDFIGKQVLKRALGGYMDKIRSAIEWLNAVPGRKRGIGAALLGISAGLRFLGKTQFADAAEAVNGFVQNALVPGADFFGGFMALWGLLAAKKH